MIPVTRKELYLNRIVGNNDYPIPEKPITIEEFFFAEILGEAVQAPEPLTRYQMYLAKIAGREIEIPYPEVRLEYFLARAAGMEIETPTPITREEIYWDTYISIKTIEGIPPLTFKAKKAGTLNNYRIYGNTETKTRSYSGSAPLSFPITDGAVSNYRVYGNTVNGESVGELVTDSQSGHYGKYAIPVTNNSETSNIYLDAPLRKVGDEAEYVDYAEQKWHRVRKNLLKNTMTSQTINGVTFTVNSDGSVTCNGTARTITYFNLNENFNSTLYAGMKASFYQSEQQASANTFLIRISKANRVGLQDFQMNNQVIIDNGDSLLLAIRINSGYTCNNLTFYPMIRKADITDDTYEPYISDTEVDVTVPSLLSQSSTNSLSVGTAVQPSSVAVDVSEVVSCGDRTKNLLQNTATSQTIKGVTFTVNGDGSITCNGTASANISVNIIPSTFSLPEGTYILNGAPPGGRLAFNFELDLYLSNRIYYPDLGNGIRFSIQAETITMCCIAIMDGFECDNLKFKPMIRKADITDDTYEPYGYKIPVTLTADSAETTDIYLDTPLAKLGNNADYIDYAAQKRHNSDGTESSVTLPEISTLSGTNTLTVGTEVQPSSVEIKGRIQEVAP